MKTFIAMETGLDPENIHTTVLGGHGDEMVPLVRFSSIGGIPLTYFLTPEQLDRIVAAPATAAPRSCAISRPAARIMRPAPRPARWPRRSPRISITFTLRRSFSRASTGSKTSVLVCRSSWAKGVENIIELDLNDEERAAMKRSADLIRSTMAALKF